MTSRHDTRTLGIVRLATRATFVAVDFFGVLALMGAQVLPSPWNAALVALGSALLTVGISLPVGLYYQARAEAESLGLIDGCRLAGVKAIFKSRQSEATRLRVAIDTAASASTEISLLGVALRSVFDASAEHTQFLRVLDDYTARLRILLLKPDSDAARRRAIIEEGNTTIDDIRHTLEHGIPALLKERLRRLCDQDGQLKATVNASRGNWSNALVAEVAKRCQCDVRAYVIDPIVFLAFFRESVFAEQYHFGRPKSLRYGSCIGKHVPIIEYAATADAGRYFREHFERLWGDSTTEDLTQELVRRAGEIT